MKSTIYLFAIALGIAAGILDVTIGDLLLTALFIIASTMLLGVLQPSRPWRWTIIVATCVPISHLLAYFVLHQKSDRAHIYESFAGFLTGIAGAYGGALGRKAVGELFGGK